jgi:hypothetical protein
MQRFEAAPWATALKAVSALGTLILVGVAWAASRSAPPSGLEHHVGALVALLSPAVAVGAILFVVRGYEIDSIELRIERLLWTTGIPLPAVARVWADPKALRGSLRIFGNGGLYSITGLYWSRKLGRYRAFITDPKRTVVVLGAGRVLVVSPSEPALFVDRVRALHPGAASGAPDEGIRPAGWPGGNP